MRRFLAVAACAAALLACGDDDTASSSPPPSSSTTTATTAPPAPDRYAERGPFEVGQTELALDDGRRVVVWYPTEQATEEQQLFDIAALLSPDLQAQIPDGARPLHPVDAHVGAAPAASDGAPYPLVLFSHGFAGFPEQSAHLTTHLASWGFVVAAPDHVERSLGGLLGTAAQGVEPREDADVLAATLDAVLAHDAVGGVVDGERVAVIGHSAGAGASWDLAVADDRIDAFILYSVGGREAPAPDVPGMVMLGTADGVLPADGTREVYAAMTATPRYLVEIEGAGHLVFSDICLIGADGGGVIAIADTIGLDIPDNLRRLGRDGCGPEALPVADAFPAIDDLSVAFLRATLAGEDDPATLDPSVTERFTTATVTLTAEG